MLSDINIAIYKNPLSNVIQDLNCLDKKYATTGLVFTGIVSTHFDHGADSVDVQNENISLNKENILLSNKYYFYISRKFMNVNKMFFFKNYYFST